MKNILFVCTGNTCRSSMAEKLLKDMIEQDELLKNTITVTSAGVAAKDGDKASINAIRVLKSEYNLDLEGHKAKKLNKQLLEAADLVLTMSSSHGEVIKSQFPYMASKIHTLNGFAFDMHDDVASENIGDPYGGDEEIYKKCGIDIKNALDQLILKLKH